MFVNMLEKLNGTVSFYDFFLHQKMCMMRIEK